MKSLALPEALVDKTVVVTRRAEDAGALCVALRAVGARVVCVPSIATAFLPQAEWVRGMDALAQATCVAFASRQGVDALAWALAQGPFALPACAQLWSVGHATQARAQAVFERPIHVAEPQTGEGLAARLIERLQPEYDRVVLPSAKEGRTIAAEMLQRTGFEVCVLALYATTPRAGSRRGLDKGVDYVLFTSPSCVAGWLQGGAHPPQARCVSIGPTTSQALRDAGLTVFAQARTPSASGLVAAILENQP